MDAAAGVSTVLPAEPTDREELAALMASAFDADPLSAWVFPDAATRHSAQSRFFGAFLDLGFADGQVVTTDDRVGVAVWLPVRPGVAESAASRALPGAVAGAIGSDTAALARITVLAEQMDARHPASDHEYLAFLAVAREHQNRGVGSRLLTARLAELDLAGRPGYLEASSPDSARLYRRHGFQLSGAPLALPDGPPVVPMSRAAT